MKQLIVLSFVFSILLSSCGFTKQPEPTPIPTATPATAEARMQAYQKDLQLTLAGLKNEIDRIEQNKHDAPDVAFRGVSVYIKMLSLERMPIPSDEDLISLGYDAGLDIAHRNLISALKACSYLGAVAMDFDTERPDTRELLKAHEACKTTIENLEKEEGFAELFACPNQHPLCSY